MNFQIAQAAIERPVNTWLLVLVCFIGGLWGIKSVGRLEDPAFTIKQALVITAYPGATALEVEQEVTELLESNIQQLPQLKRITSKSKPGISEITVEMQDTYDKNTIPQVWDELRRRVTDVQKNLPQGTYPSIVNDNFGDVYGIFYAITAPDFSYQEIQDLSVFLRRELLTIPNVAKVETAGEQKETIYIEISSQRVAHIGLSMQQVIAMVQSENTISDAGAVTIDGRRIRIVSGEGFDSLAQIEALRFGKPGTTEQISLIDIATIYRDSTEIPEHLVRFNGKAAFTLAVSGAADANIVTIGQAVESRLTELKARIPLGVEIQPIYEQHKVVDASIDGFIENLIISVAIVIVVLCLMMGWHIGLIVGATLLLTVLGTLLFMSIFSIDMERISLGALIIAMGMMVDNAIVVAEGMLINMQRGMATKEAACTATNRTQVPLLGATIIGIMAFSGIGLSSDVTGEFLFSLFAVISFSLMLSWILAITVTPLFGYLFLNVKHLENDTDPYAGLGYRVYQMLLNGVLHARIITVLVLISITAICFAGFASVKQEFFPYSNSPLFYIHYQLPEGTDIRHTADDMDEMEPLIRAQSGVVSTTSFIGHGASRYMLTYNPELPNTSYGVFIVRVSERNQIDALAANLKQTLSQRYPNAQVRTERLVFGPAAAAKIEVRFSGADPIILRNLSEQATAIMGINPALIDVRNNWRQQEPVLTPIFNAERARIAGIGLNEVALSLQFATTGVHVSTYRENNKLIPIIIRPPDIERHDISRLNDRLVYSAITQRLVPISQVIDRFEIQSEEVLIGRRNRVRTLTAQADPALGLTAHYARNQIKAQIEAIHLPDNYKMEWGGEFETSRDAQTALNSKLPMSMLIMLIISILLFGKVRQPLIIWLIVPMSVCGVVIGLLVTGKPFSFMALLGLLSLSGMLMKNAIVLVDEIDTQIAEDKEHYDAIIHASVSRIRPVFLAAATTILGMLPLINDPFFASMAVTIMGGLAFATLLTLIAVPVFYALFFKIKPPMIKNTH